MTCCSTFLTYLRWLPWQHFLLGSWTSQFNTDLISAWACTAPYFLNPAMIIYYHVSAVMFNKRWAWKDSSALVYFRPKQSECSHAWYFVKASDSAAKPTEGCDCVSAVSPPLLSAHLPPGRVEFKLTTVGWVMWLQRIHTHWHRHYTHTSNMKLRKPSSTPFHTSSL